MSKGLVYARLVRVRIYAACTSRSTSRKITSAATQGRCSRFYIWTGCELEYWVWRLIQCIVWCLLQKRLHTIDGTIGLLRLEDAITPQGQTMVTNKTK
ncbi:hypothetical protein ANANG_G00266660 [Anguilla anguilla]|uniref:Uncharacterized protein n=1 Tax=Anguilla anguilla TaxID=7936 RepID=A0A9D3LQ89_ANGAN|nr:hypothetical protein ANANG_G00266660 [Anguilla anguilla]